MIHNDNVSNVHDKFKLFADDIFLFFCSLQYGTQISAETWRTVHEPIVAGVFLSKKNSSALLVQTFCAHCLFSHTSFCCSRHKQLNGNLKDITLVMLTIHEQVALISSPSSETRLLLYVH